MFKSTTIRAAPALPALFVLLVMLSFGAMTAQAATVASTVHYQRKITLSCSGSLCSANFPALPAKQVLNVTRVTCIIQGPAGSTLNFAVIGLVNASNVTLLPEYMSAVFSSAVGTHAVNQAVDLQIVSTQHMLVALELASGTATNAICTAIGTLDTLQ